MIALRRFAACFLLLLAPALARAEGPASGASNARIANVLDNLAKVKPVGPVALSPDGKTVAMVLAGTLTVQGIGEPGSPRTPSVCAGKASGPRLSAIAWSPDNLHLAVLADCGETTAVYLLERQNSSDTRLTPRLLAPLHGFAKTLAYAPDGKHVALLYVEGATRPSGALAAMKPPSGVIGVEGLEIQRVATIDTASGQLAQLTSPGLHVYEFSWSPNSTTIAYIAAPPPGENNWWVAKLYTQSLAEGQAQQILDPVTVEGPLHGLQIAVPRFSPDGTHIAFIGGLMSDQGATGGDLYLVPAHGGQPVNLTPGIASTPAWLHWQSNSSIQFTEIASGASELAHLSISPDFSAAQVDPQPDFLLPETIGSGGLEMELSFASNGMAAMSRSSLNRPPEVWLWSPQATPADRHFTQLTSINADSKPAWGKSQQFNWTSDGFHVDGWLLYPADYDPAKKYPLIVLVHGGPSSAVIPRWPPGHFGAAPFSAAGYFVLEPNPRGSYGQGEAFTQANRKDFGHGDLRDVLAGIDAVEKQLPIDDKRVGLTGWSYGGFMTMFDITQTQRFRAAVAGAGISNWQSYYGENSIDQWMLPFFGASVYDDPAVYAKSSAITYIKQAKTPTLVVVGDRDGECPAPQSFEFWHALKAEGVDTQLVVYPNEGHGFTLPEHQRDVVERAVAWFDTHMQ